MHHTPASLTTRLQFIVNLGLILLTLIIMSGCQTYSTFPRQAEIESTTTRTPPVCDAPCWAGKLTPGQTKRTEADEILLQEISDPAQNISRSNGGDGTYTYRVTVDENQLPPPVNLGGQADLYFRDDLLETIVLRPFRDLSAEDVFEIYGEPDQILVSSSGYEGYTIDLLYSRGIRVSMGMTTVGHNIDLFLDKQRLAEVTRDMELSAIHYYPPKQNGTFADLFRFPGGWPTKQNDEAAILEFAQPWRGYGVYDVLLVEESKSMED